MPRLAQFWLVSWKSFQFLSWLCLVWLLVCCMLIQLLAQTLNPVFTTVITNGDVLTMLIPSKLIRLITIPALANVSLLVSLRFVLCSYRLSNRLQKLSIVNSWNYADISGGQLFHLPVKPYKVQCSFKPPERVLRCNPPGNWVILIFSGQQPCTRII